jgi:uncharacterized damage-inducible protein DinB
VETTLLHPTIQSPIAPAEQPLPAAILPLVAVLGQLGTLVDSLTDEQYRTKPVAVVSSNVGGHVRHCLDHIDALLAGVERGALDYDRRQRGTEVETSRQAALDAIRRLERRLHAFPRNAEARPLRLSVLVSGDRPAVEVTSSVGRELAFVLSHTIHHNALIAVVARALGAPVPERFGYAPSTIAHLEEARCVR